VRNPKIDMEPITRQEQDDDIAFQYLIKLNPPDFINYALPRTIDREEIITDEMRFDRSRAREYYLSTRGSGKGHLYDHHLFIQIYKGIK